VQTSSQAFLTFPKGRPRRSRTPFAATLLALALIALAFPATSSATFAASAGGEPQVTNTPTNSHFFDWSSNISDHRFCITVYRPSPGLDRGCVPSNSTYYSFGQNSVFSQTENALAHGTLVGVYPTEYFNDSGTPIIRPCSGSHCSSSTLIDLSKPQLTVFAAGTATYTNNPQIPLHIDYFDDLSHPWFAGGNNAAVYICQSRTAGCTNSDLHNYVPQCSVVGQTRFSSPGNGFAKTNTFDCMYDFTTEPDGLVALCARASDQSIPDPDPTANEGLGIFPTHINQFINPATGSGWTADKANISDSACGSVILDRGAPSLSAGASDTTPRTGDLVTFSASGTDAVSGIAAPYTWDFGDNTPNKNGANITHTYGNPGTYRVELSGQDNAGNAGTDTIDIVVTTVGGTGDDGTVVNNPPNNGTIGGGNGTQQTSLGQLKVVAPKKHNLGKRGKRPKPIRLALIASKGGAFQAALTKGPRVVSKGAGVLARAGTFGFKLKLPKGLAAGPYKLRVTFVPDGAATGRTKTISVKLFRPRRRGRAVAATVPGAEPSITIAGAPPLAPGYGR
jgi:PKD domain